MQIIKQILSFLLLLILQISFANSFASGFSNEELCVFSIENSEKPNSDFLEADFEENNIFEPSYYEFVSFPTISFCDGYPELVDSWNTFKNAGLDDLATDVKVLESYSKVKRVGSYTEHVKPTRVSELTRAHGAPKLGQEADILKHETTFSTIGYDLSKPIPVIELPDGTLLLADGHHRLKAMENLGQVVDPVDKLSIYEAKQLYGEDGVATLVEVAKLSGNYKGTYTAASGLALERAQNAAIDFMNTIFPGW